ncbi:CS1 type fimbrial major subunit [Burkholderia cepacia]|uniref:CS1 type fimbrial major subunit n=1 Tax=Burkholderia cepacia TaxID=292 RepID=UPI000755DD75|nr:CS1 type fimbrial major subunit [Burkholderia cepacia]KVS70078.1 hypothetical protein WK41_19290 [Burkholderia cepacia]
MNIFKITLLSVAALASMSVMAVQKDITVVADVDTTLEMLRPDGSALPQTVNLDYVPGVGLREVSVPTKIFTNAINKGVNIRLVNSPVLAASTGSGSIPLTVKYNSVVLGTTNTLFAPDRLGLVQGGTGAGAANQYGGSNTLPLAIGPTTRGVLAQGRYQGVVSIVLTQAP